MSVYQLIYAPNDIFRKKAKFVETVNKEIQKIVDDMFETLDFEKAVGIGANMIGILKRIIVINLEYDGKNYRICMINPEILWKSKTIQIFEESSLCFPGISASITRPDSIKIKYLDYNGKEQEMDAEGFLATVIQHEIDYLDGKIFLDYLSKTKRDILIKKMQKNMKLCPPHIHSPGCIH